MKRIWLVLLIPASALPQRIDQLRQPGADIVSSGVAQMYRPEYTAEARAAGLQGTVSLYVDVGPDGSPSKIKVLHGLGLGLDEKAVKAAQQWQFKPATRDGQPISLGQSANINFRLDDAGPWRIRMAAYRVVHNGRPYEVLVKPVLSRYTAPDPLVCPGEGGRAIVGIVVGTDGIPHIVRPLDSSDALWEAAAKAIESWQYVPGTADGNRRESNGSIEFECGKTLPVPGNPSGDAGTTATQPTVTFKTDPDYSEEARKAKYSGTVTLRVIVDPTGHATRIEVVRPLGLGLDENAVEAVEEWRFMPGMKGSQPVNVRARIDVNFRLL